MWRRLLNRFLKRSGPPPDPAYVDRLTGLRTRHVMNERLRAARRAGQAGAVAIADLDRFKAINDHHGHEVADEVLKLAAERLQAVLPMSAEVFRIGGEEFLVFLPGAGVVEAGRWMDECLKRFRRPIGLPGAPDAIVTLSAGVAAFTGQSIGDLLRAADTALYAAKARGRDQVVVFDEGTQQIVAARRELASAVVELQHRNRLLRDAVRTDALTGLRNRLALDEVLDGVVGTAGSRWAEASVAFIDIDYFGDYNKLHTDASGDDALRAVAAAVRLCAPVADLVFRKGGEEFVVVLPGLAGASASVAAERMRCAVERLALPHAGSAVAPVLTVTVGVAGGDRGHTVRQLMNAAAEQAMNAKLNHRRNSVHEVHLGAPPTQLAPPGSAAAGGTAQGRPGRPG